MTKIMPLLAGTAMGAAFGWYLTWGWLPGTIALLVGLAALGWCFWYGSFRP